MGTALLVVLFGLPIITEVFALAGAKVGDNDPAAAVGFLLHAFDLLARQADFFAAREHRGIDDHHVEWRSDNLVDLFLIDVLELIRPSLDAVEQSAVFFGNRAGQWQNAHSERAKREAEF